MRFSQLNFLQLKFTICFVVLIKNITACSVQLNSGSGRNPNNVEDGSLIKECGKLDKSASKIINGISSQAHKWPWMVSVRFSSSHNCGGSLINSKYVITAAHCLNGVDPENLKVIVGLDKIDEFTSSQVYYAEKIIMHESFDMKNFFKGNDIALIKLKMPVSMSSTVIPICLPQQDDVATVLNNTVKLIGWGRVDTEFTPTLATNLQEADMLVANQKEICTNFNYNLDALYCIIDGSNNNNKAQTCYGDSGGPMFHYDNDRWFIYGIISFTMVEKQDSKSKCLTEFPSYSTKVPLFINWISEKIQNS